MAKKRGNNRNTKAAQHVAPKMTASTPNPSAKTNGLSEDDQKLLELAKKLNWFRSQNWMSLNPC